MSLNNRIYFRDRQSPEHGDSACAPVPDGARATTVTPLRFAIPKPQPRALKNDMFPRTNWSLVCAISRHNCYPIPAFLNGSVSLSSHTLGNVICFPMIPSGRWACRSILSTERTRRMHSEEMLVCGRCNVGCTCTWLGVILHYTGSKDWPVGPCVALAA